MRPICPEHRVCHTTIYQYNRKIAEYGDESSYVRDCAMLYASPEVSWSDILKEADAKTDEQYLESVTIIYLPSALIISLSVKGFISYAKNFYHAEDYPDSVERRKINLAKELVTRRDYYANGGEENKDHKQWDYWPKD